VEKSHLLPQPPQKGRASAPASVWVGTDAGAGHPKTSHPSPPAHYAGSYLHDEEKASGLVEFHDLGAPRSFLAPFSEGATSYPAAGTQRTVQYESSAVHVSINGESVVSSRRMGKSNKSGETLETDELLESCPSPSPSSLDHNGDRCFVMDFCGNKYVCSSPLGRILYQCCGRLVRRALCYPGLFFKKIGFSVFIFYFCWYTMHLGGAMATMRFPRTYLNQATPLPDIMYEILPGPGIINVGGHKLCGSQQAWFVPGADACLGINLFLTLFETFTGKRGHVHVQRALHMSAVAFIFRASVVGLSKYRGGCYMLARVGGMPPSSCRRCCRRPCR
jgi:hypothetical protein